MQEIATISPEALEFTNTYLTTLDLEITAQELGISLEQSSNYIEKAEVKKFINTVFLEQGYMNKFKITSLLEKIIVSKLEEAEETGIYSNKDLMEIVKLLHTIHMDHSKAERENSPSKQTNVQVNNYGDNLSSLVDRVIQGETNNARNL